MIYKNIILSLLFAPLVMAGNNANNTKINELKEAQFQKEYEISNLSEMIAKKSSSFYDYKSNALDHLKCEYDVSSKEKVSLDLLFNQLIEDLEIEFDHTNNIKLLLKEGLSSNNSQEMMKIALLRVMLEERFINKLIVKIEACIQELIEINAELNNLEGTI